MTQAATATQSQQGTVKIKRNQLPLSCPRPEDEVWNMHPRVYLAIEETGDETCPYCGTRYKLED